MNPLLTPDIQSEAGGLRGGREERVKQMGRVGREEGLVEELRREKLEAAF